MSHSEKEIIARLKDGNESAYRYLFDHHYPLLCQIAAKFLKDDFLAETIVGDVIFHLWEIRDSLEIQITIRAYLVRAVRNRCINYLRQQHVVKEINLISDDDFLSSGNNLIFSEEHPLANLLEKELEKEIESSISKLPHECRTVFEMSRFDNLKYQEIAEKLEISINTVKYHIKNALSRLSEDLGKYLVITIIPWIF